MHSLYQNILDGNARFGTGPRELAQGVLECSPEEIRTTVILAPVWEPERTFGLKAEPLTEGCVRVWQVELDGKPATWIVPGIGAPTNMDVVLALGATSCKRILFIGSAGALDEKMELGDIVLPEKSICGDGASRYLQKDLAADPFAQAAYPDGTLLAQAEAVCKKYCAQYGAALHRAVNFSIDTIAAQFAHMDEILALGCGTIEMETAACFRAAELCGIPIAAIFGISDSTVRRKSLYSGRTEEEKRRRREIRSEVFPRVLGGLIL
jgi:purine-nucleoside phosphorylase